METPTNAIVEKEKDPVATPKREESSLTSDIETGEGEHEGIGIRESGHGILYHLKLCMLCLLRGMKIQNKDFHLTAEHKMLNPFDDIVLLFNTDGVREYHMVQVKHGQLLKEKKIMARDFLKEKFNNWGNQFTLHKYFNGYCELKKKNQNFLNWLKQSKGKWLSRGEVCAFTKEMVDEINALPSKGLDFSYKLKKINDLISDEHLTDFRSMIEEFLIGEEHLLQIISKNNSYLSLLKIHQILKQIKTIKDWETNSKHAVPYIRFKSLSSKESIGHLQSGLSNENNYKLMIIYCKEKEKKKFSRIFSYLYKIAKISFEMKKKIILITENPIYMEDLEEEIPNLRIREVHDVGFTFFQLISEIKENLLRKEIVSFQENFKKTSLALLVMSEDSEKQMVSKIKLENIIDCDVLVRLIKGKDLRVGNFVEETKVLSDIYLDRQLENIETSNIIHENDLSSISDRVVVIIDEAGSGKSTLLNSIIRELKETKPCTWICRINLINYTEVFKREMIKRSKRKQSYSICETENTQIFFIGTLLDSQTVTKLETPFEKNLFRLALQGYMKLFLVFDGFDEICPDYKGVVVQDLLMSLNVMKFDKLYVTSRENGNPFPIEISGRADLKTVPVSEEQQEQFLVDCWAKEVEVDIFFELDLQETGNEILAWLRDLAREIRLHVEKSLLEKPLILVLTAEYVKDTAKFIFYEPNMKNEIEWVRRKCNFNFIELCRCFIKKKILIYQEHKSKQPLGNISSENKHKYFIKTVQNVHTHLALTDIFGQQRAEELNRERPNIDKCIKIELPKIGIVYKYGNTFPFIRRTFAEFFVIKFICSRPGICETTMEIFFRDTLQWWSDTVFEYLTECWLDITITDREINRVKYILECQFVLTYIGLVRRYGTQRTRELTGDEGLKVDDDMKAKLLSTGLVREEWQERSHWKGLSIVYWRLADYFADRWFRRSSSLRLIKNRIRKSSLYLDD